MSTVSNSVNSVNSVNSYSAVLPPSPMVFFSLKTWLVWSENCGYPSKMMMSFMNSPLLQKTFNAVILSALGFSCRFLFLFLEERRIPCNRWWFFGSAPQCSFLLWTMSDAHWTSSKSAVLVNKLVELDSRGWGTMSGAKRPQVAESREEQKELAGTKKGMVTAMREGTTKSSQRLRSDWTPL